MGNVFIKLLNMSITAGWLVLAALLFRALFKRSPKWIRCVLWAMVAVRLVFPFAVKSNISIVPSAETVSVKSDIVNENSLNVAERADEGSEDKTVVYRKTVSINSGIKPLDNVLKSVSGYNGHISNQTESDELHFYDILGIVWLIGAASMLMYAFVSFIRIKRQVISAVDLEKNILLCDGIYSSFIFGIFRPRIYLPTSIIEKDRKYMLAHEKAHLKRRDHLWKPLGFIILSVYWFNPLMWLAYILLCRDIEFACDEKVIKDYDKQNKADYLKALVECSVKRTTVAACPLAFGETGVKERAVKVLNYKKPAFWIIIVSLIACAAAAVLLLTDPQTPPYLDLNVSPIDEYEPHYTETVNQELEKYIEGLHYGATAESGSNDIIVTGTTAPEPAATEAPAETTTIEPAATDAAPTDIATTETTAIDTTAIETTSPETKTTEKTSAKKTNQLTKKDIDDYIKKIIIEETEKSREYASKGIDKGSYRLVPERNNNVPNVPNGSREVISRQERILQNKIVLTNIQESYIASSWIFVFTHRIYSGNYI